MGEKPEQTDAGQLVGYRVFLEHPRGISLEMVAGDSPDGPHLNARGFLFPDRAIELAESILGGVEEWRKQHHH